MHAWTGCKEKKLLLGSLPTACAVLSGYCPLANDLYGHPCQQPVPTTCADTGLLGRSQQPVRSSQVKYVHPLRVARWASAWARYSKEQPRKLRVGDTTPSPRSERGATWNFHDVVLNGGSVMELFVRKLPRSEARKRLLGTRQSGRGRSSTRLRSGGEGASPQAAACRPDLLPP